MRFDTHELAWAAGFWDGEGYTGAPPRTKNGQPQVHMKLAQSGSPDTLLRFQRAVGGLGYIHGPYQRYRKSDGKPFKPTWMWGTNKFEHRQQVMACLWPWLSDVKRQQMLDSVAAARAWFDRGDS